MMGPPIPSHHQNTMEPLGAARKNRQNRAHLLPLTPPVSSPQAPLASPLSRGWLSEQLEHHGGPSEAQFQTHGELNRAIRNARRIERVQALLDSAQENRANCPYWLSASDDFAGIQGNEGRVSVWLESGGGGSLGWSNERAELGGGGAARIMPAMGIGQRVTLAVGFGLGASGVLPEEDDGTREFRGVLSTIVPLVIRATDLSRIYDVELALSTRFVGSDAYHGARASFGIGLTAPRVAGLMPYALLWTGYEYTPTQHGSPEQHSLWLGSRVGFDWHPRSE